MKQQLTTDQVKTVDDFLKDNYIKYTDVRVEFVDHLAAEIEAEMSLNPNETFGKILWKLGHKSGPEFKKLVKSIERQLFRYWLKKYTLATLGIFISPYLLIVIAAVLVGNSVPVIYDGRLSMLVIPIVGMIIFSIPRYSNIFLYNPFRAWDKLLASKIANIVINLITVPYILIGQAINLRTSLSVFNFEISGQGLLAGLVSIFAISLVKFLKTVDDYYQNKPELIRLRIEFLAK